MRRCHPRATQQRTQFQVIAKEQISINLVNEHIETKLGVHFMGALNGSYKELEGVCVRVILSIDNENQRSTIAQQVLRREGNAAVGDDI